MTAAPLIPSLSHLQTYSPWLCPPAGTYGAHLVDPSDPLEDPSRRAGTPRCEMGHLGLRARPCQRSAVSSQLIPLPVLSPKCLVVGCAASCLPLSASPSYAPCCPLYLASYPPCRSSLNLLLDPPALPPPLAGGRSRQSIDTSLAELLSSPVNTYAVRGRYMKGVGRRRQWEWEAPPAAIPMPVGEGVYAVLGLHLSWLPSSHHPPRPPPHSCR